jgi:hypothetical protein
MSWRDIWKVHPAADLFPLLAPDELRALAKDIKENDLKNPIIFWTDADYPSPDYRLRAGNEDLKWLENYTWQVLDGRNRLAALELLGKKIEPPTGCVDDVDEVRLRAVEHQEIKFRDDADPYAYVISANIHRRHLTTAQKGELIEALLKAKPERSDRATADIAKADHKTVAAKREKLEATGEIPQLDKRAGSDGRSRSQPAAKAKGTVPLGDPARPRQDQADPVRGRPTDESGATEPVPQELAALKEKPSPPLVRVAIAIDALARLDDEELVTVVRKVLAERGVAVITKAIGLLRQENPAAETRYHQPFYVPLADVTKTQSSCRGSPSNVVEARASGRSREPKQ